MCAACGGAEPRPLLRAASMRCFFFFFFFFSRLLDDEVRVSPKRRQRTAPHRAEGEAANEQTRQTRTASPRRARRAGESMKTSGGWRSEDSPADA